MQLLFYQNIILKAVWHRIEIMKKSGFMFYYKILYYLDAPGKPEIFKSHLITSELWCDHQMLQDKVEAINDGRNIRIIDFTGVSKEYFYRKANNMS